MKRIVVTLYVVLVILLGVATLLEHFYGSGFVAENIYHKIWFCCLWGALAAGAAVVLIRRAVWRQLPLLLFHGSLLVILAGAMLTFAFGKKGFLHLRPGVVENHFVEAESHQLVPLPFTVRLDSFRVACYPGTEAPADYISYLTCHLPSVSGALPDSVGGGETVQMRISMNRILTLQGFRFYQSSFDEDREGSWLTVNHDPWGTGVTYAGYLLFGFSALLLLLGRRGEFRTLLRHPLLRKGAAFCLLGLLAGTLSARESDARRLLAVLNRAQADSLASKQVIYNDRVAPLNTLATDFVSKLTGKRSYKGLTPEQVLGSWLLHPEEWREEPMIRIKNSELRHLLRLDSPYARLTDLFDGEAYRLQGWWQEAQGNEPLLKAIRETDEKVGLILMLTQGTLIRPLPTDGTVRPLSEARVQAELFYNRVPLSKLLFMSDLTLGLLAFFRLLWGYLHRGRGGRQMRRTSLSRLFSWLLLLSFAIHLAGYLLRWYIAGRVPLSNGYETMLFLSLSAMLMACLLHRRFPFTLPFGFLLSGFALLVAYLGQMNPQITPLMPVLVSPWLSIHVSLIMVSYALLAFVMLNGVLALSLMRGRSVPSLSACDERVQQLTLLSRLLLYPAVCFLGAGIFFGAVWANVSWGRYWAWDPKEVWALITFLVYGAAFHGQSLPLFRRPRFFHLYMVLSFLSVLMTYFGVNYLLGGMHSYANA